MRRFSNQEDSASGDDVQDRGRYERDSHRQGYSEDDDVDVRLGRDQIRDRYVGAAIRDTSPVVINNRIRSRRLSEVEEYQRSLGPRERRRHRSRGRSDTPASGRYRQRWITPPRPAPVQYVTPRPPPYYTRSLSRRRSYSRRSRRSRRRVSRHSSPRRPRTLSMAESDLDSVFDADNFRVTFQEVENNGLSINVPLSNKKLASQPLPRSKEFPLAPEVSAWQLPKTCLSDGQTSTQLRIVHSTEFSYNESGLGKTTIVCPPGLQKQENEAAVQMRWLHVQQTSKKLKTLEDLVLSCPYIDEALLPVAVEALEKVKESFSSESDRGAFLEHGSILRLVGKYSQPPPEKPDATETDSVLFFASPFLSLQPMAHQRASPEDYLPRTLLQTLYGYEVGGDREGRQVVQRLGASKSKKHLLHVSQLWCLLVGSNILITLSEKSAEEIQGKTIFTDLRNSGNREPLLIRLTDAKHRQYPIVVERDYNYAEFLKYAVSMVGFEATDASNFDLFDEDHKNLTPTRWIEMMGASDTKLHNLWVIDRTTYFNFPQSEHNRSRSRSRVVYRDGRYERHRINRDSLSRGRMLDSQRERRLREEETFDGAHPWDESRVISRPAYRTRSSSRSSLAEGSTARVVEVVQEVARELNTREPERTGSQSSSRKSSPSVSVPTERKDSSEAIYPDAEESRSGSGPQSHQRELVLHSRRPDVRDSTADDEKPLSGGYDGASLSINEPWKSFVEHTNSPGHPNSRNIQFRYVDPRTHRSLLATERSDPGGSQPPEHGRNVSQNASPIDRGATNERGQPLPGSSPLQSGEAASAQTEGVGQQDFATISRESDNLGVAASAEHRDLQISRLSSPKRERGGRRNTRRTSSSELVHTRLITRSTDSKRGRRIYSTRYVDGTRHYDSNRYVQPTTRSTAGGRQRSGLINNDISTRPSPPRVYELGGNGDESSSNSELSDSSDEPFPDRYVVERTQPRAVHTSRVVNDGATVSSQWQDPRFVKSFVKVAIGRKAGSHVQRYLLRREGQSEPDILVSACAMHETDEQIGRDIDTSSFEGSSRVFHLPAKKDEKTGKYFDRYVIDIQAKPGEEGHQWEMNLEWPPLPEEEPEAMQIDLPPFLTWRLNTDKDERTPEQVETTLISILSRLNKSLSSGVVARMYSRLHKCTMTDLVQRHEFLLDAPMQQTPSSQNDSNPEIAPGQNVSATGSAAMNDNVEGDRAPLTSATTQPQAVNEGLPGQLGDPHVSSNIPSGQHQHEHVADEPIPSDAESHDDQSLKEAGSIKAINHHHVVLTELFDVSKAIFDAFVPSTGSPSIHHVSSRFWGAIDDICRQALWEFNESHTPSGGRYFTRDFDATPILTADGKERSSTRDTWSSCVLCKNGEGFTSADEALEHLHNIHFECSGKTERPYDDPCYAWLKYVPGDGPFHRQIPDFGITRDIEAFVSQLLLIRRKVEELHSLVANAQNNTLNARPPLPSNLVHAFEKVLSLYVIQAQEMSLSNRLDSRPPNRIDVREKINELVREEHYANELINDYLQGAKKDIILLKGTSRHVDSAGVEAVGAEFLAMSLMVNLQNKSALTGQVPTASSQADFVQLYERYSSRLRFQANRRPTKRVFLDIHGLEEELDALDAMVKAQDSVLGKYLKLLAPGSTRITNATRVGLYKAESEYARAQQRRLRARQRDIRILREKSERLKEQVKTTLEILEEDHGKAIRVFTFVTLLFLPLSFVTSFMGMNTKDLRDMEFTQNIFWMTGLPVTLVVITLALIYAYQGEALEDWVSEMKDMWARRRSRSNADAHGWMDAQAGESEGIRPAPTGWTEKDRMIHIDSALVQTGQMGVRSGQHSKAEADMGGWLRDAKHRFRRRRGKRTNSGMRRRATAESTGL